MLFTILQDNGTVEMNLFFIEEYKEKISSVINKKVCYDKSLVDESAEFNRILKLDEKVFSVENKLGKFIFYKILRKIYLMFKK